MAKRNSLFKPAKSNNGIWNLTKTVIQTAVFWSTFLFIFPHFIVKLEIAFNISSFQPTPIIGWILFSVFSLMGLYSGYTMSWIGQGTPLPIDCPNKLVVNGPYKFVRNPMAVSGIGQGISVGIIFGSFMIILYALVGASLWHLFVRPIEEKDLETRFGKSYLEYKANVKCWIPDFK